MRFALIGILCGIILKLFVLDIVVISGTSMENSLKAGDFLLVNKLVYGVVKPFGDELLCQWSTPKRNDVIIYLYNSKIVVKRCVAVAGDTLDFFSDSQYSFTANGSQIPLTEHQYQRIKHSAAVPDGTVLAVGDNYHDSIDSRDYGFVPVKNIMGKGVRP
jgi:signal peptidase I